MSELSSESDCAKCQQAADERGNVPCVRHRLGSNDAMHGQSDKAHLRTNLPNCEDVGARMDESGNETPDTDKEDELLKQTQEQAQNQGIRMINRASFKRTKADRSYDQ